MNFPTRLGRFLPRFGQLQRKTTVRIDSSLLKPQYRSDRTLLLGVILSLLLSSVVIYWQSSDSTVVAAKNQQERGSADTEALASEIIRRDAKRLREYHEFGFQRKRRDSPDELSSRRRERKKALSRQISQVASSKALSRSAKTEVLQGAVRELRMLEQSN